MFGRQKIMVYCGYVVREEFVLSRPVCIWFVVTIVAVNIRSRYGVSDCSSSMESTMEEQSSERFPLYQFFHRLFVDRENEIAEIIQWTQPEVPGKPLRFLVAPVGGGKSWLCALLYQQLRDRGQCVFWLDFAPNAVNPFSRNSVARLDTPESREKWLSEVIADAESCVKQLLNPIDPILAFEVKLNILLGWLCQAMVAGERNTTAPLLIIDGFEDLNDQLREDVEKIIDLFHTSNCTRILIASRGDILLTNPHLAFPQDEDDDIKLEGLEAADAQEQVTRRVEVAVAGQGHNLGLIQLLAETRNQPLPERRQALMGFLEMGLMDEEVEAIYQLTDAEIWAAAAVIEEYLIGIPFANAVLFVRAVLNKGNSLRAEDLRFCLDACGHRARLEEEDVTLLIGLVHKFPTDWNQSELQAAFNIQMHDKRLDSLVKAGVIDVENSRHIVTSGLRSLIEKLNKMSAPAIRSGQEA